MSNVGDRIKIAPSGKSTLFVVGMLLAGGLIIGILSSNEFDKKARGVYFSDPFDWRPAVVWSRDRVVAIANTNDPEEPLRAILLAASSSTLVEAINRVPVTSILAIRDSRRGEFTAIVYWIGKKLTLGIWEKGNEDAPVQSFSIGSGEFRGARIAWSSSGKWVFCLLNRQFGPCILSFTSGSGQWDSRGVGVRSTRVDFNGAKVEWSSSFQPIVSSDSAGLPSAIYAVAGVPERGSALYRVDASRAERQSPPTPILWGTPREAEPAIVPSVTQGNRIYESGLMLPQRAGFAKYSDLWTPGSATALHLNSNGVWGLSALPSFPQGLCGVLAMSRDDANVWLFKVPEDLAGPVIGLRQITTHAHVDGDPLIQEQGSSVRVIYVEKSHDQYRVHMLVFPRNVFERVFR